VESQLIRRLPDRDVSECGHLLGGKAYLQCRKVDDIVNVRMLLEHFIQPCLVGDVDLVEDGAFSAEELNAVDDFLGRIVQIVDYDDLVVCIKEGKDGEGANVASTAA